MLASQTTTSLAIESISDRPVWVSTSVTSASQRDDRPGLSSGTGTINRRRFLIVAIRRSMVTYCNASGPPISKTRPFARGVEHSDEVAHDVGNRDRLRPGASGCAPSVV